MPQRATLAGPALAALILSAPVLAADRAAFPELALPDAPLTGEAALARIGDRLPALAAWYRHTPEALAEILKRDAPLLRLDRQGRLYVVDELQAPLPPARPLAAAGAEPAPAPLDQTFLLHSRPGAQRTIYLDFNGATLTGTAWNTASRPLISAQPFDADGNTAAFSSAELERIQYIWQRVAEDYAPFDIDVTTEAPSPDRLTRSSPADNVFGTTVLITNRSGVYDCSCGGVAYVGIYDDTSDFYKPALVFWDALGPSDEKYVAEAISHEAGHNLGLSHDGSATTAYYPGHGSGPTGWAPIMGVGYYQPLAQWSKGEYAGANNQEDDIARIPQFGGPVRPDDHGDAPATATALVPTVLGSTTSLAGSGVIESRKDRDAFSFQAGAGTVNFAVSIDSRSPNLDAGLALVDAAGQVLAKSAPKEALPASLQYTLPAAGTYYVVVAGVGKGDVKGTGYSDYASLGQFGITGTVPTR